MKKGRARRHREARSLKQVGWVPRDQFIDQESTEAIEPCAECGGGTPEQAHAQWCLAEESDDRLKEQEHPLW